MSMSDYSDAIRQCFIDLDVNTMRKLWAYIKPNMPQPEEDEGVLISLHYARTLCETILFRPRAYSHAWLCERALPSGLPDRLRPRAERMYPRVVPGVGISVNFSNPALAPLKRELEKAMSDAVLEVAADGKINDSVLVRARMGEARQLTYRRLFGRLKGP